jgi:hypothetical protein
MVSAISGNPSRFNSNSYAGSSNLGQSALSLSDHPSILAFTPRNMVACSHVGFRSLFGPDGCR